MLYLKNLVYHPTACPNPILKNINLELPSQQMGLIVGRSGSGKSTLLEILAGLAEKTSGDIRWREQELTPEHLQQLGGLVFQFPERHFCGGTILEELRLGHPELGEEQINKAMAEVGLGHLPLRASPPRFERRATAQGCPGSAVNSAAAFATIGRTDGGFGLVDAAAVGKLVEQVEKSLDFVDCNSRC